MILRCPSPPRRPGEGADTPGVDCAIVLSPRSRGEGWGEGPHFPSGGRGSATGERGGRRAGLRGTRRRPTVPSPRYTVCCSCNVLVRRIDRRGRAAFFEKDERRRTTQSVGRRLPRGDARLFRPRRRDAPERRRDRNPAAAPKRAPRGVVPGIAGVTVQSREGAVFFPCRNEASIMTRIISVPRRRRE